MMQSKQFSQAFFLLLASSAALLNAKIVNITTPEEYNDLLKNEDVAVVKFSAEWCGACKSIKAAFDRVAKDPNFKHVTFAYVDADKSGSLLHRKEVTGLPTFIHIRNGVEDKKVGVNNPETFENDLRNDLRGAHQSAQDHVDAQNPAKPVEETAVNHDAAPVAQEVPMQHEEHEGIVAKVKSLVVMVVTKIKDLIVGILDWVKGLFGK